MSRKSDTKNPPSSIRFQLLSSKVPSNTLAGEKFTHIVRLRPIGHALKKITEITIDKSCRNDAAGALMTQKSPISHHHDVGDKNACLKK